MCPFLSADWLKLEPVPFPEQPLELGVEVQEHVGTHVHTHLEVGATQRACEGARPAQGAHGGDLGLDLRGRGRGERHTRRAREVELEVLADARILGLEVDAPLRGEVSLVDRNDADLHRR